MNSSSTSSNSNTFWYCLTSAFFGSVRILTSASRSRLRTAPIIGRRPMNSGIIPNLTQVLGQHLGEQLAGVALGLASAPCRGSRRPCGRCGCSMICSSPANAPPQMNSTFVVSIWMNSWCGCLRPPCGGTEACVPSRIFSSACCTPSPRHVAGDRRVLALAGDLVDLVDVDDAGLGPLDVEVGGLDQLEEDVLDVLADVAGLGERGGVGDGERHVEQPGEGLGEVGLAAAGGAEQQDVALRQLDLVAPADARRTAGTGCAGSGCRRRPRGSSWRSSWPTT